MAKSTLIKRDEDAPFLNLELTKDEVLLLRALIGNVVVQDDADRRLIGCIYQAIIKHSPPERYRYKAFFLNRQT